MGIRKAPGFLRAPCKQLLFTFFRFRIGAEVVFLNKNQRADSFIPWSVSVLTYVRTSPFAKFTVFAVDYLFHMSIPPLILYVAKAPAFPQMF